MTSFVTTTRVESSRVLRCISGHFHSISEAVVLWGYSNRLELYRDELSGVLSLFHKQHTHDRLLELGILHGGPSREQSKVQVRSVRCHVLQPLLEFALSSSRTALYCQRLAVNTRSKTNLLKLLSRHSTCQCCCSPLTDLQCFALILICTGT